MHNLYEDPLTDLTHPLIFLKIMTNSIEKIKNKGIRSIIYV
jgi:hypothetical protein